MIRRLTFYLMSIITNYNNSPILYYNDICLKKCLKYIELHPPPHTPTDTHTHTCTHYFPVNTKKNRKIILILILHK